MTHISLCVCCERKVKSREKRKESKIKKQNKKKEERGGKVYANVIMNHDDVCVCGLEDCISFHFLKSDITITIIMIIMIIITHDMAEHKWQESNHDENQSLLPTNSGQNDLLL